MGALGNFFKGLFGGGSSSSKNNSNTSTSGSQGTTSAEVNASIKRKYKNVDGENKLKGALFTGLIEDTNEVIDNANTKKENTKIQ